MRIAPPPLRRAPPLLAPPPPAPRREVWRNGARPPRHRFQQHRLTANTGVRHRSPAWGRLPGFSPPAEAIGRGADPFACPDHRRNRRSGRSWRPQARSRRWPASPAGPRSRDHDIPGGQQRIARGRSAWREAIVQSAGIVTVVKWKYDRPRHRVRRRPARWFRRGCATGSGLRGAARTAVGLSVGRGTEHEAHGRRPVRKAHTRPAVSSLRGR